MSELTILCVDDEVIILNSLLRQLQEEFQDQYVYEMSETAEEALEMLAEIQEEGSKVIVIVSDWLMPGMKGDEFLIEVHKKFPKVVKILLTGQADEEAVNRVKNYAKLDAYISKPWNKEQLMESIKSGLMNL